MKHRHFLNWAKKEMLNVEAWAERNANTILEWDLIFHPLHWNCPHSPFSMLYTLWPCSLKFQSISLPKNKTIVRIPSRPCNFIGVTLRKTCWANISSQSLSGLVQQTKSDFNKLIIDGMFALGPFPAGSWNKSFDLKGHGAAAAAYTTVAA